MSSLGKKLFLRFKGIYLCKTEDQIFAWIKRVAVLNDESLKEENNLIHQSLLKAFAILVPKSKDLLRLSLSSKAGHPWKQSMFLFWLERFIQRRR
jgi:hypothetical protein